MSGPVPTAFVGSLNGPVGCAVAAALTEVGGFHVCGCRDEEAPQSAQLPLPAAVRVLSVRTRALTHSRASLLRRRLLLLLLLLLCDLACMRWVA